jgi:NAD(P)-dependent dehydrogenase (short-subunit alcohol dehydrogenase family)
VDWRAEYEDRIVCVVGGTSGIGRVVANAFHSAGAAVFATASSEESASRARQDLPATMQIDPLDVRDAGAIAGYCSRFDELDVLVNTVGASFPFQELEPVTLRDTVAINLTGVALLCSGMYPALRRAEASVINYASMTAFFGSSSNPIYSAAKGGLVQLTKSLALLWGPDRIRVNAVAPGYIRTRLTERRWDDAQGSQEITGRTPLGRWGEPDDLVGPTLFLGSSAAAFVTGAVLPVDGGFLTA